MQREEMIILAGKYVLGLLSKQDEADTERRKETDPAFRYIVAQWQDRLAELNHRTEPIEPSSELWQRIVRQLNKPANDDPDGTSIS
jgi:anti-sigma-K factor RskA